MYFFRCPKLYCCRQEPCQGINQCAPHRIGPLCGRCKEGFSEAIFSVRCIDNVQCNNYWFLPFCMALAAIYGVFLLFQQDITGFLFAKPLGQNTKLGNDQQRTDTKQDEGGIFLILLFYYFYDAAIIQFRPAYVKSDSLLVATVRSNRRITQVSTECSSSGKKRLRIFITDTRGKNTCELNFYPSTFCDAIFLLRPGEKAEQLSPWLENTVSQSCRCSHACFTIFIPKNNICIV